MSSLTRAQYLAHLKLRSGLLNSLADDTLSTFLDAALRIYSSRLPEVVWSVDNVVVAGQVLYDYPASAVRIISVRVSDTEQRVLWTTEDQGSGDQLKIGAISQKSYESLLNSVFYSDPLNFTTEGGVRVTIDTIVHTGGVGYAAFDIEYAKLQTIANISDTALEILPYYIDYLALNLKAEDASLELVSGDSDTPASITDISADGSATTVSYDSISKVVSTLEKRANTKLKLFDKATDVPFGTRE